MRTYLIYGHIVLSGCFTVNYSYEYIIIMTVNNKLDK